MITFVIINETLFSQGKIVIRRHLGTNDLNLIMPFFLPTLTVVTQKFFERDDVELEFKEGALQEIAKEAIKRKTGARALRAIIENIMLEVMYEVPSNDDIRKVVVPEGVVAKTAEPLLMNERDVKEAS